MDSDHNSDFMSEHVDAIVSEVSEAETEELVVTSEKPEKHEAGKQFAVKNKQDQDEQVIHVDNNKKRPIKEQPSSSKVQKTSVTAQPIVAVQPADVFPFSDSDDLDVSTHQQDTEHSSDTTAERELSDEEKERYAVAMKKFYNVDTAQCIEDHSANHELLHLQQQFLQQQQMLLGMTQLGQMNMNMNPFAAAAAAAPFMFPSPAAASTSEEAESSIPEPSRFCHICTKSCKVARQAVCCNITSGICRKVICEKCFIDNGWDFELAVSEDSGWCCPHCAGVCPERAQCKFYKKANKKVQEKRKEERRIARMQRMGGAAKPTAPKAPNSNLAKMWNMNMAAAAAAASAPNMASMGRVPNMPNMSNMSNMNSMMNQPMNMNMMNMYGLMPQFAAQMAAQQMMMYPQRF